MKVKAMRLSRSVLLGLLALGSAQAPGISQDAVKWVTDLNQASRAAAAGKQLMLVCFNMDGEESNERALQTYRSAEFRKATDNVICVLCSADQHSTEEQTCPRFSGCTCHEHIASEKQARRHFFGGSSSTLAPQHILLYPDGVVAWQAVYDVVPAELLEAIATGEKLKSQVLDQRLRAQLGQLALLSKKAAKGSPTAYMQLQAMLVQTPAPNFCEALQALSKQLAERVLHDIGGMGRDQALALLDAVAKHPTKTLRDLAVRLAAEVRARPREEPVTPAPAVPKPVTELTPLAAPLDVLLPATDFARVHWAGPAQELSDCLDRVTVLWYFVLDMPNLTGSVATMNQFAKTNSSRGIVTVGLVATARTTEAVEKLAALGCRFPVGAYSATADYRPCGVERFPAWVVLDPDTNVVFRTPQDGSSFDRTSGCTLAVQMVGTPSYAARIKILPAGK